MKPTFADRVRFEMDAPSCQHSDDDDYRFNTFPTNHLRRKVCGWRATYLYRDKDLTQPLCSHHASLRGSDRVCRVL